MEEFQTNNLAVFIDFQNIAYQYDKADLSHAKKVRLMMISAINYLKSRGRLIVKNAYADWTGEFAKYRQIMLENSVELTEIPSQYSGKNNADIKLVVDALEIAMTKAYIDTFVVVSGDSDYAPLISKIREYNKYVIVIGTDGRSSALLKGYCDELKNFSDIMEKEEEKIDETNIKWAYNLLRKAVTDFNEKGKMAHGSIIRNYMIQLESSFDQKKYKDESGNILSKWNDFLKYAEVNKAVKLEPNPKDQKNYIIHLYTSSSEN
jgi:uncharacterized LabA/DUF88 family protein